MNINMSANMNANEAVEFKEIINGVEHRPLSVTKKVEEYYTEKDKVSVRYVCTTSLQKSEMAIDIFFRQDPHPKFGNRYFGICEKFIMNADSVENLDFAVIRDNEGVYHYSRFRNDLNMLKDGQFIDGGRDYTRSTVPGWVMCVRDGAFLIKP